MSGSNRQGGCALSEKRVFSATSLCYNIQITATERICTFLTKSEMKLSRKEVQHIALLARLGLSQAEIEKFRLQLSDILENFEVLKQVDTTGLPPTAQSIALQNILRPDEAKPSYPVEEIMNNAPQREGNSFKVRAVLE